MYFGGPGRFPKPYKLWKMGCGGAVAPLANHPLQRCWRGQEVLTQSIHPLTKLSEVTWQVGVPICHVMGPFTRRLLVNLEKMVCHPSWSGTPFPNVSRQFQKDEAYIPNRFLQVDNDFHFSSTENHWFSWCWGPPKCLTPIFDFQNPPFCQTPP